MTSTTFEKIINKSVESLLTTVLLLSDNKQDACDILKEIFDKVVQKIYD